MIPWGSEAVVFLILWPGFMDVHHSPMLTWFHGCPPFPSAQLVHEYHRSLDGTAHFSTSLLVREQFTVVCAIWEFTTSPNKEVISVSFLGLIVVHFKILSLRKKNDYWTVKFWEINWITLSSPWHYVGVFPLHLSCCLENLIPLLVDVLIVTFDNL